MAVRVVTRHPGGHPLRRAARVLATLLGGILAIAGLVTLTLPSLVLASEVAARLGHGEPQELEPGGARDLAIMAVAGLTAVLVGRLLIRGRRRQLLLLRKFGFADASRLMTVAVGTALGRRWRLVTLDDDEIAPLGASRSARRLSSLVVVVAVGVIVVGVLWLSGSGLEGVIDRAANDATVQAEERGEGAFETVVAGALGGLFAGLIVGAMVALGLLVVAAVTVFAAGSYLSVRRAERAKKPTIRAAHEVDPVVRRVDRRSRRVFAARLVVVRVAGAVWQEAVRSFARTSDAVVVDLSAPTENLLWEIESGSHDARARRILVGRHDRVGPSFAGLVADPEIARRLDVALDGEEVIAYDVATRGGRRRFARALRNRLEDVR